MRQQSPVTSSSIRRILLLALPILTFTSELLSKELSQPEATVSQIVARFFNITTRENFGSAAFDRELEKIISKYSTTQDFAAYCIQQSDKIRYRIRITYLEKSTTVMWTYEEKGWYYIAKLNLNELAGHLHMERTSILNLEATSSFPEDIEYMTSLEAQAGTVP